MDVKGTIVLVCRSSQRKWLNNVSTERGPVSYREQSDIEVQSSYFTSDNWIIFGYIKHLTSLWEVIYEIKLNLFFCIE